MASRQRARKNGQVKLMRRGADALHISIGSVFPHPLNPPGSFAFDTAVRNYDAMLSSGLRTFRELSAVPLSSAASALFAYLGPDEAGQAGRGGERRGSARNKGGSLDHGHQHRRL